MRNIIQLLPDSVANQIAAGEVVQRPASVVKELLENAIDAEATEITLILKDAGRTLVQVIDNGKGMSTIDARMCFERHATSKLKSADDLFNLYTKGFRGEALASIAAVAQVELKTKTHEDSVGTLLQIEGSRILKQEPCTTAPGSSIAVKNLFYNIPARRNFLKSNNVELKHIIDELHRVALPHANISFSCYHNDNLLYQLTEGKLKNRLIQIFGTRFQDKLAPVEEETDVVKIRGFIAKPEIAKKTRGEQYFFVNDRFIKHPYFHHAVTKAFEGLIKADEHPVYFLFLKVNPKEIDVNIHPTKTEVKFSNEKIIYPIVLAAVRKALGTHNFIPSLDFEHDNMLNIPAPSTLHFPTEEPALDTNPFFNPFEQEREEALKTSKSGGGFSFTPPQKKGGRQNNQDWQQFYEIAKKQEESASNTEADYLENFQPTKQTPLQSEPNKVAIELNQRYIVSTLKSGLVVIDKFRALERIFYDKIIMQVSRNEAFSQQVLFPYEVYLRPEFMAVFQENEQIFSQLGFDITVFGKDTIAVNGLPEGLGDIEVEQTILEICENLTDQKTTQTRDLYHKLAIKLASKMAFQNLKNFKPEEMSGLMDKLFACEIPFHTASGNATLYTIPVSEIEQKFN